MDEYLTKIGPPPAGTFPALCVKFEKLEDGENFNDPTKPRKRIAYSFTYKDGDPVSEYTIERVYTATVDPRGSLCRDFSNWLDKPLKQSDMALIVLGSFVGMGAMITVEHVEKSDRTFANITAVKPPRGKDAQALEAWASQINMAFKSCDFKIATTPSK